MKEELISYDTAKLAKEKGFDIECDKSWRIINSVVDLDKRTSLGDTFPMSGATPIGVKVFKSYYAPTQSLLQRWLREKHGIDVGCTKENFNTTLYYSCTIFNSEYKYTNANYEQALEKGLIEALKLIK